MKTVKIPSPSIKKLEYILAQSKVTGEVLIDQYMAIIASTLGYVGGTTLRYENERVEGNFIEATIDTRSLPDYRSMVETYSDISFQDELLKKIRKAHKVYGLECPLATPDKLGRSLNTWSDRWITVYIWTLLCCSEAKDSINDDADVINSLLDELQRAVAL